MKNFLLLILESKDSNACILLILKTVKVFHITLILNAEEIRVEQAKLILKTNKMILFKHISSASYFKI